MKGVAIYLTFLLLTVAPAFAAHKEAAYSVPHDVATWIVDHDIVVMVDYVERTDRLGCDDVAVGPARDRQGSLYGYLMLARNKDGTARLVAVEMFNIQRQQVYGYRNVEDYDALVACHTRPAGISL